MDRANAARIEEWDSGPVSAGYTGLQELGEAGFSGVVSTGTTWLFMLNGRVVGVADGTVSSFESAELTAYEAPDPTLPLLFAMQEESGEPRAKYYTDDNPLAEVHETLTDAGFTGYLELSDNVLSGDYYVVYYGGKSMSAAFVGNTEQLISGDEAFRQAAEEVGIYSVFDVDLDVRDVPTPAGEPEPDETTDPSPSSPAGPATPAEDDTADTPDDPALTDTETDEPAAGAADPPADGTGEPAGSAAEVEPANASTDQSPAAEAPGTDGEPTTEPAEPSDTDDPFSQEEAWREARTIPALDPEETDPPTAAEDGGQRPTSKPSPQQEPADVGSVDDDRIARLEAAIEQQNETIEALESRLESSSEEVAELRQEREALRDQLNQAQSVDSTGSSPTGQALDADSALDQTDLFVRYGSKGKPTLQSAHDGDAEREAVVENLRIDHHTRFEDTNVNVDGRPFEAFLEDSLEYRFVEWLVTDFLFEIKDTGSQRGLRHLFDAIPLVDRVEFMGTVTWRDQDAGETNSQSFDIVCRDRMGQALIVANLNDVRDPATGDMMESLIESASESAGGIEDLGGAFMVTSSFFRPDALETASTATDGGLLSRDKRWSFVKLDRRHGYHLCLVEARGEDFHVAVPEL